MQKVAWRYWGPEGDGHEEGSGHSHRGFIKNMITGNLALVEIGDLNKNKEIEDQKKDKKKKKGDGENARTPSAAAGD